MSEQSSSTRSSVNTKWTMFVLSFLGVATLLVYRIAVHSKGVADIKWFLKLVAVQAILYFFASWLSLRTKDSRSLLLIILAFATLFRLAILFSPPYLRSEEHTSELQ